MGDERAMAVAGGPLLIGVDVGTQSCKAIVYELESKAVVSSGAKALALTTGPGALMGALRTAA